MQFRSRPIIIVPSWLKRKPQHTSDNWSLPIRCLSVVIKVQLWCQSHTLALFLGQSPVDRQLRDLLMAFHRCLLSLSLSERVTCTPLTRLKQHPHFEQERTAYHWCSMERNLTQSLSEADFNLPIDLCPQKLICPCLNHQRIIPIVLRKFGIKTVCQCLLCRL